MNLIKKNKFRILNSNLSSIQEHNFKYYLFIHINSLNNLSRTLYKEKDILFFSLKLDLLKKMTKNKLLLNLLSGPTYILAFNNLNNFLQYNKFLEETKIGIPLAILIKNKFYSYNKFVTYFTLLKRKFLDEKSSEIKILSDLVQQIRIINIQSLKMFKICYIKLLIILNKIAKLKYVNN